MGDGRPTCNRVLTSVSVGMGIPMGIPVGIPVGMGWVWGLKCHPHGSPGRQTHHAVTGRNVAHGRFYAVQTRLSRRNYCKMSPFANDSISFSVVV